MSDADVYVGDSRVIYSGTVLSSSDDPVIIDLDPKDKDDNKLKITFLFVTEENAPQKLNIVGAISEVTLSLINFNNTLGTGPAKPVEIASNTHNVLSVHFRVYTVDSDRMLHFSFYSRPKKIKAE